MNAKVSIVLIVGYTGAGKTTVANKLSTDRQAQLLTFKALGQELASAKGYKKLRDYFGATLPEISRSELDKFLQFRIEEILSNMNSDGRLVIDGLISPETVLWLKNTYENVSIIYLNVPRKLRLSRICERLKCTQSEARLEERLKNGIKQSMGIDTVIESADYHVDGTRCVWEIVNDIVRLNCL
jgi:dephospho-CoA kinase